MQTAQNVSTQPAPQAGATPVPAHVPAHVDVLIVGAGISGIGSAYHLQTQCPWASYTVLETLESFGGTWLTHRYPGIRSDSDLFTFGYRFKPWSGPPIATAEQIMTYLEEVIDENGIGPHIHYGHRIDRADWSSADARWTVQATNLATGEAVTLTANFLWMCSGYYDHAKGYTPEWPGMGDFKGQIVHPQLWPEDLDYTNKRVVVIGSGATAATLVPAIADKTAHVTLLQRSPTYFIPRRNVNDLADQLRYLEVDPSWIHEIVRRQILAFQQEMTLRAKNEPEAVKAELIAGARAFLPPHFDVEKHFSPRYRPWQQRIAFVPDGDLFRGIAAGKASVVTDTIDRFTEKGVRLTSGEELEADIIVTATGFNLLAGGGVAVSLDGAPVDLAERVTYRGLMWEGVPNLAWIMGYFRASWTLRADLIGDFVCRMLNHMKAGGFTSVTPQLRPEDRNLPRLPWVEEEDFNPGYLQRGAHRMPKRLDRPDWRHSQDYWSERKDLPAIDFAQAPLAFAGPGAAKAVAAE